MAQSNEPKTIAIIPGSYLKWIHIAEVEFHRKHLNLDDYNVSVIDEDKYIIVYIKSSDAPEGSKGSSGSHVGYSVEISKKDSNVVKSYYLR